MLYLPPTEGEYLQGDIFAAIPSIHVAGRPLQAVRLWKQQGDRELWGAHAEGGREPGGGFKWTMEEGGENVIARGYLSTAMLITHDCEIENDLKARTLAMVRPLGQLDDKTQDALFRGDDDGYYALFPLESQDDEPRMERSFVDFRRLTTVHPDVLDQSERIASVSQELRQAIAERFRQFLFRRVEPAERGE